MTKIFLLLSLAILAGAESHIAQASAQNTESRIQYRKNQYSFDAGFGENATASRSITRAIQSAGEDNIDFVRIVTYVTPTSSEENDLALAEKRAVDTKWLIAEKFPKLQGRVIYETRRSSREGDVSIVTVRLKNEMERKTFTLANTPSTPSRHQASRRRTVKSLPLDITSTTGDMFKDVRTDNPDVYALEAHLDYKVNIGLLIGGMLPFVFSALTMESVSKAAYQMIEEVRRQFHSIPGIMEGKAKPDYKSCVAISTTAALKEMLVPGIMAVIAPLLVGLLLGANALGGMLAGALVTGVLMAIFMSNAGGAWDNAKKYIEGGEHGGKGSEAHKAAVVGDTVGDPFKDTSGPSINILIKLMTIVSLVFAPIFSNGWL